MQASVLPGTPVASPGGRPADGRSPTRVGLWWESHPRLIRAVAGLALLWWAAYLAFRLIFSGRGVNPLAFAALGLVELYNFTALAFLAFFGWSWSPARRPPATPGHLVDVYVTTYDEPPRVVEAALAGCAALTYPHKTWLLDDGRRPEMADLAERWGAGWITRPDNSHAKAGNINHALGVTSGDLVFVLDADHVPLPDALDAIVGYFDDPSVALVQTPHDFYNQDSVQHYDVGRHEQSIFFEVICPGKDRHNGVFWCGSATVLRKSALQEVGGVATDTIAEDFHTTIKMHSRGWKTRYHNEILVQGLAPFDLDGYLLQRDRWARGNLSVFRLPESPLGRRCRLSVRQRLSYFASLYGYGTGLERTLRLGLLTAVLALGALPARISIFWLAVLWLPSTLLAMVATTALCRGRIRLSESSHYTLMTAEIFARAARCSLLPSRARFKVTPKEGADAGGWAALRRIRLALALGAALAAALVWRAVGWLGWVHERSLPGWVGTLAFVLGAWELFKVCRSVARIARRHQRRIQYRFSCAAPVRVSGWRAQPGWVRAVDVSTDGIGLLSASDVPAGTRLTLHFALPDLGGGRLEVAAEVAITSCRPKEGGGWRVGSTIRSLDEASRRSIVRYCYVVHPWMRHRPGADIEAVPPADESPSAA